LDADAAVRLAAAWRRSDSKPHALFAKETNVNASILTNSPLISTMAVTSQEVAFLESVEHVVLYITTVGHTSRGEIEISLASPSGTESELAWTTGDETDDYTPMDKFMTVRNWDERPAGTWSLKLVDTRNNSHAGVLLSWTLAIYGKCCRTSTAECTLIHGTDSIEYDVVTWSGRAAPNQPQSPGNSTPPSLRRLATPTFLV